ncbi:MULTISPECIES: type II secretion system major pseudopilin GspG [Stenotrophomonas]|jgi:general secretion pathway protein G|uniref:type II secretion system major pseudopilin GspG n=1 Tax=Stenotrophomonas TaxID=40323 RepID=UPI000456843E|nr:MULTISPECIES: type II secretion system major pseudopilin GspG [Stenotrophomonas]AHY60360.1 general secretion pathway protein GspG [Stenotrophomonas rhizophila]MDY0955954.1 type II secretion system major pseudopilin GspG [Stenotrophomonas rhizophila]PTT58348.1 type II secretion system protein GspG [Stenotrophomonas sp. HMWF003]QHB70061.1 type II secretion system major pseudopilin GspG [Stenotrophomonas sp. 364]TKK05809.1 type II secretion system protein GspG [Stenotrophomonas rhizophila]
MQRRLIRFTSPRRQAGMSLLEIIIVIVLIGAVLTLVGSRVLGGADRGKANIAKSQVQTVAGKVENYQLDTGKLPAKLDDLVTQPGGTSGWLGPYAKPAELNDPWGHPLEYRAPGEGQPFDLISLGKDGKVGGSSYDADIKYE